MRHKNSYHYVAGLEFAVLYAQATAKALDAIKQKGFRPDAVIGHAGWGDTLYVKAVFSTAKLIHNVEFFLPYHRCRYKF